MPTVANKITGPAKTIYRLLVTVVAWGAIALLAYLLFPLVSAYVSRSQVIAIIVGVNALATVTLWREAARYSVRPPRPNKDFLNKLLHSERITPKHDPPKPGGNFSIMAGDDDKLFFAEFAPFAEVVNEWLADEYVGRPLAVTRPARLGCDAQR
jgi:hypothetical protein